ncbi:hypothetical protein SDRG_11704 [Saprolegnia diclina VS20]|uniref:Uncharacterized protein n=1 Tax=Saprolegnia diclina (strain VS20) TaxID=1156394 RepID=T0PYM1_SAPDV|nr:hypothetical protein SDRG_11704 [Saprolegnia diclina VS20]EQC30649.1 hypothetical protein SDRG_11704 [Saprolegnia diclina VS20]|eukprot:XP_008615975.1 hypothetical protein SDRG_11704 [Saprolegnia diclina VS20]
MSLCCAVRSDDALLVFCNYVLNQPALLAGDLRPAKRARTHSTDESDAKRRRRRRVTFSTTTTFEFPADVNGSAVPLERGPPIGLGRKHVNVTTAACPATDGAKNVRKLLPHERILLLQALKYTHDDIAFFARDANATRDARRATRDELLRERQLPAVV